MQGDGENKIEEFCSTLQTSLYQNICPQEFSLLLSSQNFRGEKVGNMFFLKNALACLFDVHCAIKILGAIKRGSS